MASRSTDLLIESRMADALAGDPAACFDLGVAHSAGDENLIEAHKWFDLAARAGYAMAETCRANIAWRLSPRQLAEARRRTKLTPLSSRAQVARFSASAFA